MNKPENSEEVIIIVLEDYIERDEIEVADPIYSSPSTPTSVYSHGPIGTQGATHSPLKNSWRT